MVLDNADSYSLMSRGELLHDTIRSTAVRVQYHRIFSLSVGVSQSKPRSNNTFKGQFSSGRKSGGNLLPNFNFTSYTAAAIFSFLCSNDERNESCITLMNSKVTDLHAGFLSKNTKTHRWRLITQQKKRGNETKRPVPAHLSARGRKQHNI